jgi:hypothetical protein
MEGIKKVYTAEDIKKIAPRYKGKPENFYPNLLGKKRSPMPKAKRLGPSSDQVPKADFVAAPQKATPQTNESIISELIFGVDITVVPIDPRQNFTANYSTLPLIAQETRNTFPT